MRVTVKPWTWRHGHTQAAGVLVTTHLERGRTIVAFIPDDELHTVADALHDLAEQKENP